MVAIGELLEGHTARGAFTLLQLTERQRQIVQKESYRAVGEGAKPQRDDLVRAAIVKFVLSVVDAETQRPGTGASVQTRRSRGRLQQEDADERLRSRVELLQELFALVKCIGTDNDCGSAEKLLALRTMASRARFLPPVRSLILKVRNKSNTAALLLHKLQSDADPDTIAATTLLIAHLTRSQDLRTHAESESGVGGHPGILALCACASRWTSKPQQSDVAAAIIHHSAAAAWNLSLDERNEQLMVGAAADWMIAAHSAGEAALPSRQLHVGMAVEAKFRGEDTWFSGKVDRVNNDGTYDIVYEDGDSEDFVEREHIRAQAGSGNTSAGGDNSLFFIMLEALSDAMLATKDNSTGGGPNVWRTPNGLVVTEPCQTAAPPMSHAAAAHAIGSAVSMSDLLLQLGGCLWGMSSNSDRWSWQAQTQAAWLTQTSRHLRGVWKLLERRPVTPPMLSASLGLVHQLAALALRLITQGAIPVAGGDGGSSDSTIKANESFAEAVLAGPGGVRSSPNNGHADYQEGATVLARYGGEDDWLPGKVVKVNDDGSCDILYDADDDEEERVTEEYVEKELIKLAPAAAAAAAAERVVVDGWEEIIAQTTKELHNAVKDVAKANRTAKSGGRAAAVAVAAAAGRTMGQLERLQLMAVQVQAKLKALQRHTQLRKRAVVELLEEREQQEEQAEEQQEQQEEQEEQQRQELQAERLQEEEDQRQKEERARQAEELRWQREGEQQRQRQAEEERQQEERQQQQQRQEEQQLQQQEEGGGHRRQQEQQRQQEEDSQRQQGAEEERERKVALNRGGVDAGDGDGAHSGDGDGGAGQYGGAGVQSSGEYGDDDELYEVEAMLNVLDDEERVS
jgi:hypothetical protein